MADMNTRRINADKPHLWKTDIAASVDGFNQWFMDFAPEAFRSTRVKTTEHVKRALLATSDLRALNAATLKATPGALPTLRMCTAPPLAVERFGGLGLKHRGRSSLGTRGPPLNRSVIFCDKTGVTLKAIARPFARGGSEGSAGKFGTGEHAWAFFGGRPRLRAMRRRRSGDQGPGTPKSVADACRSGYHRVESVIVEGDGAG